MNDLDSVRPSVEIPSHCQGAVCAASLHVDLPDALQQGETRRITDLKTTFPDAVVGLSDHTLGNYTCLCGSRARRADSRTPLHVRQILARSGCSDLDGPSELRDLVNGSRAVFEALGGGKTILGEDSRRSISLLCVRRHDP